MGRILDHYGRPLYNAAPHPTLLLSAAPEDSAEYEGASTTHRLGQWGLSGAGPNAVLSNNAIYLRNRGRTLRRNNAIVAGGVDSYVSNLVGTDITPSWDLDDPEQKAELEECWHESSFEMDYYGATDFYSQQEQVASALIVDGECLARMHVMPGRSGLLVPFKTQIMEADHLDLAYNTRADNGNEIRNSIEWDQYTGARAAYHLWRDHPGEAYLSNDLAQRVRVPAQDICHIFRALRPGQQRGGSFLAPLIAKLNEIDRYDDAEVVRKKTAALFGGFFVNNNPLNPTGTSGPKPPRPKTMEPGTFFTLPQGWDVRNSEPADVGGSYEVFLKAQFRQVARGLGITYEQLTGDLSDVNFSSLRAALIEFRRQCEMMRVRMIINQFTRPVVLRWLHVGMLSGAFRTISLQDYLNHPRKYRKISYIPDAWEYVNPVDDRIGEQMDIRNGLATREEKITLRSGNIDRVDRANAARNQIVDDLGLVYDSDPRKTAKTGAIQKAESAAIGKER